MPIYEYGCRACGERLEVMQRLSDPPPAACPRCGGALRKLVSAPSFQFKGSGWYVTDYARKGGAAETGGADKTAGADQGGGAAPDAGGSKESSEGKAAGGEKTADKPAPAKVASGGTPTKD